VNVATLLRVVAAAGGRTRVNWQATARSLGYGATAGQRLAKAFRRTAGRYFNAHKQQLRYALLPAGALANQPAAAAAAAAAVAAPLAAPLAAAPALAAPVPVAAPAAVAAPLVLALPALPAAPAAAQQAVQVNNRFNTFRATPLLLLPLAGRALPAQVAADQLLFADGRTTVEATRALLDDAGVAAGILQVPAHPAAGGADLVTYLRERGCVLRSQSRSTNDVVRLCSFTHAARTLHWLACVLFCAICACADAPRLHTAQAFIFPPGVTRVGAVQLLPNQLSVIFPTAQQRAAAARMAAHAAVFVPAAASGAAPLAVVPAPQQHTASAAHANALAALAAIAKAEREQLLERNAARAAAEARDAAHAAKVDAVEAAVQAADQALRAL
jgi:2-oxoglutarate dehydrogenase E2 component (dihydrolipoamide succinyltransferase)